MSTTFWWRRGASRHGDRVGHPHELDIPSSARPALRRHRGRTRRAATASRPARSGCWACRASTTFRVRSVGWRPASRRGSWRPRGTGTRTDVAAATVTAPGIGLERPPGVDDLVASSWQEGLHQLVDQRHAARGQHEVRVGTPSLSASASYRSTRPISGRVRRGSRSLGRRRAPRQRRIRILVQQHIVRRQPVARHQRATRHVCAGIARSLGRGCGSLRARPVRTWSAQSGLPLPPALGAGGGTWVPRPGDNAFLACSDDPLSRARCFLSTIAAPGSLAAAALAALGAPARPLPPGRSSPSRRGSMSGTWVRPAGRGRPPG